MFTSPVLELVAGQVGADEAGCVSLGVGQTLGEEGGREGRREGEERSEWMDRWRGEFE